MARVALLCPQQAIIQWQLVWWLQHTTRAGRLPAQGQTMVRHTKRQVLGGEEVLQLPPKTEELVEVVLTAEEQAAYNKVGSCLGVRWSMQAMCARD